MAGSTRRDLYLQVNATTDPFTRAMKAAAGTLQEFGTDVDGQLSAIQERFNQLGANDNPARALANSFRRTFSEIQAQAKEALVMPTTSAGAISLDVGSAERAAAAATSQAVALREIADAAARAAIATNGENDALRVFAASSAAAAVAAEENALGLRSQAATLADVQTELNAAGGTAARTGDIVTAAHGRMSASSMIMQHVMRSTVDSFSAGLPVTMIFGEQISRLGEAAAFASQEGGETTSAFGKFAAFMASGWGIAITAAIAVLGPLVVKLFEAQDALHLAKVGNDGLSDAQSVLGRMFDLTSGKLEHQNSLLRLNAQLTAVNLRAEASKEKTDSDKTLNSAGTASIGARFLGAVAAASSGDQQYYTEALQKGSPQAALVAKVRAGTMAPGDALTAADKLDYSGLKITKQQLEQAIVDSTSADFKRQTADEIDKSLKMGVLDTGLRRDTKPKKPKKPKVDRSVERAANLDRSYQSELGTAQDAYAKAQLQLSDTAQARLALELDELAAAKTQKDLEIDDQVKAKKISATQADRLKELNASTTALKVEEARRKEQAALLDQEYTAQQHSLAARDALLEIDLQMADTRKDRLAIERQLLADQQEARRAGLQKTVADPLSTKAQRDQATADLGRLPAADTAERAALERRDEGPLAQYRDQLKASVGDTNDALGDIQVDAFKGLESAFEGVISGSESVSKAIKGMVSSILADLAKMAIEKGILSALGALIPGASKLSINPGATSFAGLNTGVVPLANAAGGRITGPGTGTSDDILSWLSNGEFVMNAEATARFLPLLHAMNDNSLPGYATGGMVGSIQMPKIAANDLMRASGANSTISVQVDARGATDPAQVEAAAQRAVLAAAPLLVEAAKGSTVTYLQRPSLPKGMG